jgi:GMP synthase (glutamine-hydrolysing)
MSHGDRITKMPPGFQVAGVSANAPFAVIQDETRKYYGLMFHPEVVHTPHGAALLRNFVRKIAGARATGPCAPSRTRRSRRSARRSAEAG